MLASEVLSRAADLIEPEGAWTQGAFARPKPSKAFVGARWPRTRTCWCVRGALFEVTGTRPRHENEATVAAETFLENAIARSLVMFNDFEYRTQAEVVAALRKASDLARSEGQ